MSKWIKELNQENNEDNKVNHHVSEPIIHDHVDEDVVIQDEDEILDEE